MTTMRRDPLVDDYLRRLDAAAADLPRERRAELVAEIEEHIDSALSEGGRDDEVAVRNVLERLGRPEEIAAAERPPGATPDRGWLETAALIVLSFSFVLPIVGYLIGARLVLSSKVWQGREKATGLLIPPFIVLAGVIVVLLLGAATIAQGSDDHAFTAALGPVEIAVLAVIFVSGPIAAMYLGSRLRRRGTPV